MSNVRHRCRVIPAIGPNFGHQLGYALTDLLTARTYPLILSCFLLAGSSFAQPCAINIGPDQTICQGQSVTLTAPAGFPTYLWSTGSNATSITVGTAGTYWGQVSYPSGQLFANSDFSAGNTGFSTQFNYSATLVTEGNYFIGTNAASYHPQFVGTGTGNFMIVNSGWPSALFNVWCQTVNVCGGQTYTLSYRVRTLSNAQPARLQWWADGTMSGPEVTLPNFGGWQTVTHNWTSAPGQTVATLCLRAMSGDGIGNDFGLDDITMNGTIVLRDSMDLSVTPLPVLDLGPDATLCVGQNLVLDAAVPGGSYVWQDGSALGSFVVSGPGNYNVTVTVNGCSANDAINVSYNALPVVDLGPDITLCTGQTTTLNATVPGGTYGWQDGSGNPTFTVTGPGTYTVNVSANGCSTNDAINVAYNPTPVVNLGPDRVVCAGTPVVLNAAAPGGSYLWQDGSTNATFTPVSSGAYGVIVTVNGCTASDFVNVTITPLPVVNLGPDQTVCPGTSVALDATITGGTYLWQDGSTSATRNVTVPGTYTVTVTANGCSSSDSFTLSNHVLPVVNLGPDLTFCAGQNATIGSAVPGATYLWSTGASTATINVATAGIYWQDVTLNGCTVRDSIQVFVNPLPVVDLGADRSTCPGVDVTLDVTTAGATYMWSTGAASPTTSVGPGNYDVTVTVAGCSSTDAVIIGAWPAAQVDLGNDTTLCPGAQLVLNATQASAGYFWQNGSLAPTFTVSAAGTYNVTLTDPNGCVATDAINVSYASPSAINLGPDSTICQGTTITLNATLPGASYLWSTGAVTPTIQVGTAGNVSVTVTQGSCSVSDAVDILVATLPSVALGNDTTLCPGEQAVLNAAGPGLSYLWSTGAVTPSITVSSAGTFDVTVTNGAFCTASDVINVAYASPSSVELGPNITLCQGESVVFDATLPGASYLWSTGAITPMLPVSSAGQVWVEVTQGNCNVSDTVTVLVNPMPSVNLGADQTLCAGEDVILNATWPGASYLWNTGATSATLTASTTGTYTVDVDLNGCVASDAVDVTVLSATSLDLGPDVTLCTGEQVTLDATTAGATYLWSNGATTPTLSSSTAGTFWAQVTSGICSVRDTVVVFVNPMPQANLGPDVTLCAGEDIVLDATWLGSTYLWSTGATAASITVSSTGTYSVDVDLNGCVATDAIDITVLSASSLDLGPDISLCAGEQVVLDASTAGATYLWSNGTTGPTLTATTTGTYWAEITTGLCSASDTVSVTVNPLPVVDLGAGVTLCDGQATVLDATWPGASYLWSGGETSATLNVSTSGTFSVDVTLNGCTASDAILVTVLSPDAVDLGPDITACEGEMILLDATTPGATYLWSSGVSTASIDVQSTGTYWVEVSQSGCSVSDTVIVSIEPTPQIDLGADQTLCGGETSVTLDATWAGADYLWNTGATTSTLLVNASGTYSVEVDLNGCTASDAVDINFGSLSMDLGADTTLCPGQSLILQGPTSIGVTTWNNVLEASTFTVTEAGAYWAVFTALSGCSATDTIQVDYAEPGALELGADLSFCEGQLHVLDATVPGGDVIWEDNSTDAIRTVAATGTYSVEVIVGECILADEVTITFNPNPSVDLGGDVALCPGTNADFDVTTAGGTYLWSDASILPTLTTGAPGSVSVTVTVDGCSTSDQAMVSMLDGPTPELGNDTTICEGADLLLDASEAGASYLWDDGSITPTRTVSIAAICWVDVTRNGCTQRDSISIELFSPSSLDLGDDRLVCAGANTVIDATLPGATYLWNTGANTGSIATGAAGAYSVTVTVSGCTAQDAIIIEVLTLDTPDLGPDFTICDGESVVLSISDPGSSIQWSTGALGNTITVTTNGTYSVTVDSLGCTVSDAIEVNVVPFVDQIDLGPDRSLCPGAFDVIDAPLIAGASYAWSTGAVGPSLSITSPGSYTVSAIGECVDASATIVVSPGDCSTYIFVPNTFTPNGDGINDHFLPSLAGPVDEFQLDIFDRWGERIHSTNDRSAGWDGSYNGTLSQDGVYVWTVTYKVLAPDGVKAETLTGHVTLLR